MGRVSGVRQHRPEPGSVLGLEADGGEVPQGRVAAPRVVPPLDVPEDLHARVDLGPEDPSVQEFALEAGEEGFGHGIVVGVPNGPHGGADPGGLTSLPEGVGRVLGGFNRSSQHRRSGWNSGSGRALPQGYSSPEFFAVGC